NRDVLETNYEDLNYDLDKLQEVHSKYQSFIDKIKQVVNDNKETNKNIAKLDNKIDSINDEIGELKKGVFQRTQEELLSKLEQEYQKKTDSSYEKESEFDTEDKILIDNFNTGANLNLGTWDKDPEDKTQNCKLIYDYVNKIGKSGYGIKLMYDVDSPNPAYNGLWLKLNGKDFSQYNMLNFSVKGDQEIGYTRNFKIELKNKDGETGSTIVKDIKHKWEEISVPFSNFKGISDFSNMDEFVIVFDDQISKPKFGVLYFDNIYVSK
ncbi:MAG: carbohydrate binding domain-containing protein, partial [Atribacterota bacterium]